MIMQNIIFYKAKFNNTLPNNPLLCPLSQVWVEFRRLGVYFYCLTEECLFILAYATITKYHRLVVYMPSDLVFIILEADSPEPGREPSVELCVTPAVSSNSRKRMMDSSLSLVSGRSFILSSPNLMCRYITWRCSFWCKVWETQIFSSLQYFIKKCFKRW